MVSKKWCKKYRLTSQGTKCGKIIDTICIKPDFPIVKKTVRKLQCKCILTIFTKQINWRGKSLVNFHENVSEIFFTNTNELRKEQVRHRANCNSFCHINSFKTILADLCSSDCLNNADVITMLFQITQSDLNSHFRCMPVRSVRFQLLTWLN